MTDSKTATERLREMLEARGVEWSDGGYSLTNTTFKANGIIWHAMFRDGGIELHCESVTPEQAVAATLGAHSKPQSKTGDTLSDDSGSLSDATLGSGTLTYEHVEDVVFSNCELCGNSFVDIRAITDELNATLGSGECEFVVKDNMNETEGAGDVWFECSECGAQFDYVTDTRLMDANFCPNCGKAVKR